MARALRPEKPLKTRPGAYLWLGAFLTLCLLELGLLGVGSSPRGRPWAGPIWTGLYALVLGVGLLQGLVPDRSPRPRWLRPLALVPLAGVLFLAQMFAAATLRPGWSWARHITLPLAKAMIPWFGWESFADPSQSLLGAGDFVVRVDFGCSGLGGIGLYLFGVLAYLSLHFRRRNPAPCLAFALGIGVPLLVFLNSLRIALLVCLGASGSRELALGGFHTWAGWVGFQIAALATLALFESSFPAPPAPESTSSSPRPYLLPQMAILGVVCLGGLFDLEPETLRLGGYILGGLALAWLRPPGFPQGPPSPHAVGSGFLVALLWIAGDLLFPPEISGTPAGSASSDAIRALGSVLVIPWAEELFFRGYLFRCLPGANFEEVSPREVPPWGWLLSNGLFALLHQRMGAAFLAGCVFTWNFRHRGRLEDAVVSHALANAALAGVAISGLSRTFW